MQNACADIILGQRFLKKHKTVVFTFGGKQETLTVENADEGRYASLASIAIEPPLLFEHLKPNCKPIATHSRSYSQDDQRFIKKEIQRLLAEDIIETSSSPWRAQVLVVRTPTKSRLVVDYSQTINQFTRLNAYPLPKIEDLVNKISQDQCYSSVDLQSAYYQVPLLENERPYTAFETMGRLYQYKRLPFGVTNGCAVFQKVIDEFIRRNGLRKVYAYLDDLIVTCSTWEEHDKNLEALMAAADREKLTFNKEKSKLRRKVIQLLGYEISSGKVKPDPSRLQPLLDMPPPANPKELKRICGMFAYYARWIQNFSAKAGPLLKVDNYPLEKEALDAFTLLKHDLASASLTCIREDMPFEIESDASDYAIGAILSQGGRPVAFMSRKKLSHH